MLLQVQGRDLLRDLDDYELDAEGPDAEDPMRAEQYTFEELVHRCVARRVFENAGLRVLCEAAGVRFQALPEGVDEELQAQAAMEEMQSLAALGVACTKLSEDYRSAKRLRTP